MKSHRAGRVLLFLSLLVATTPLRVLAHALSPMLLELRQQDAGRFAVLWKSSPVRLPGTDATPALPAHCVTQGPATAEELNASLVRHWTVDCGAAGLAGGKVGFTGLGPAKIDALIRIVFADGRTVLGVVRAGASTITVPAGEAPKPLVGTYLRRGVEQMLGGLDYSLFVVGLLLLVRDPRRRIKAITSFTLGYSVTLSLAALGYLRVPARPIEVGIALSVFLLAVELSREERRRALLRRLPWAIALAFGLLHGLGFAGALTSLALPPNQMPLALLSFNVGIEIGLLALALGIVALRRAAAPAIAALPRWAELIPLYAMGSLAAYWVLERAATALAT